ncbi:MAG: hypothetical protein ISS19_03870 [Bacteroidales bacterium]|nr:hypothetical protein [Bacteroidales bacterium]
MNVSKFSSKNYLSSFNRVLAAFIFMISILYGCESDYYSMNDFDKTNKIDIHVHLGHYQSAVARQAIIDNFSLLTINTDSRDVPAVYYQQETRD